MIAGRPCVLIADDDPVTLQFLSDAIGRCGCVALPAAGADAALRMLPAAPGSIDLLLLDRRMPGRDGIALLCDLRAAGVAAPAVATSAELDPAITRSLRAGGFAAALAKPAAFAELHALLRRFVDVPDSATGPGPVAAPELLPLLDDAVALAAVGGDGTALRALRRLFAAELAKIAEYWPAAASAVDAARAGESLHRLRASCGICGALRLRAAAERLETALRVDPVHAGDMARDFASICERTLEVLATEPSGDAP